MARAIASCSDRTRRSSSVDWAPAAATARSSCRASTGNGVISLLDLVDGTRSTSSTRPGRGARRPGGRTTSNSSSPPWTVDDADVLGQHGSRDGSAAPDRARPPDAVNEADRFSGRQAARLFDLGTGAPGRIHVVDIDTGGDHAAHDRADDDGDVWQSPQFSPDGTRHPAPTGSSLAATAVGAGWRSSRRLDGSADHAIGPTTEEPACRTCIFSPDGTKIVATYPAYDTAWMFDADGTQRTTGTVRWRSTGSTWQRRRST